MKVKGGGTHSRSPRKRTRTTLEAGGLLSRTIPVALRRDLAKQRRDMQAVAGRDAEGLSPTIVDAVAPPRRGERPECLSHWPPCTWIDGEWVSADELKAYLRGLHRACRRIR